MKITALARPTNLWQWLLWHSCIGFAITVLPAQVMFGEAAPQIPATKIPFLISFVTIYLAATAAIFLFTLRGRTLRLAELVLIGIAAIGSWGLYLLLAKVELARPLLLGMSALAGASIVLSLVLKPKVQISLALIVALATGVMQVLGERPHELLVKTLDMGPKPIRSRTTISTAYYSIQATFFDNYFNICHSDHTQCDTPRTGGALASFSDGFLYATGEGFLHFIHDHPTQALSTRQLATKIPLNSEAFLMGGANERDLSVFRVMDILVREQGGSFDLFAAHHFWDSKRSCFVMRVSEVSGETAALLDGKVPGAWRTVWDAEPCLPLKMATGGTKQFGGDGAGGRMLMLNDSTMLVTVGDQQWDGWNWDHAVSQDPESAYGKVMKIDLSTGNATVYSQGMRNPEGFFQDEHGALWSTEHGPQGGDELNLIVEGGNYGWPRATYGTEYGRHDWPLLESGADVDPTLQRPTYAWVPSIGVSNLLTVQGPRFARWRGDLLICSFNESLHRAHVKDGRVTVMEPIMVRPRNGRLRDIVETSDGRIVLLLDLGALAFLEPLDANSNSPDAETARGALLFGACQQCHKVGDGSLHAAGPDLHRIVNRPVATAPGFKYSPAMSALTGNWDEQRLDTFLHDPQTYIPGSAMQLPGMKSAADRRALIAHLKTLQ